MMGAKWPTLLVMCLHYWWLQSCSGTFRQPLDDSPCRRSRQCVRGGVWPRLSANPSSTSSHLRALDVIRESRTVQEYRKIWQAVGKKGAGGMRVAKEVE